MVYNADVVSLLPFHRFSFPSPLCRKLSEHNTGEAVGSSTKWHEYSNAMQSLIDLHVIPVFLLRQPVHLTSHENGMKLDGPRTAESLAEFVNSEGGTNVKIATVPSSVVVLTSTCVYAKFR
ncbi:hypothetical protein Ddye_026693 [Dipteronia dyeriana]|uniref:Uncharacterized protein n=1 Tax=Dipteronia dyeriana TaxID=168575 RepID=A0AAD9WQQ4_9ROSI|nr:hypothetical protein Ddye_026693 [Dipteronia dyeriana]